MARRGKNMGFALQVAKKKPVLQDAIDNMDRYTAEEINRMSIPGWTKQLIIAEQELNKNRKGCISPEEIAKRMIEHSNNTTKE
jgi:hypothetical protein